MKTCSKCGVEKNKSEFSICSAKNDGLTPHCKSCVRDYNKQYRENNATQIKEDKHTYYTNNIEKINAKKKLNANKIKAYQKAYDIKYREDNKERKRNTNRKYREENRESIRARKRIYETHRRKIDPLYRLKCNMRGLVGNCFKNRGFKKNSKTAEMLGCTFEEFKTYIEVQFVEGMSWDNYPEWEFDHIIPVSLAVNIEHLIKLNHHTNFQPLWWWDNREKSNKFIDNNI